MCLNVGSHANYILYAIVAGGKQIANSLLFNEAYRFCNTAQAVVVLKKGQTAFVKSISKSPTTPLRANNENEWCTFSGTLLNHHV